MDIVRFPDPSSHASLEHGDITLRRLQGGEASSADFIVIGHATYPPRARSPREAAPAGRVYVVAEGALVVEQADGVRHALAQGDSVFIPAHEPCAVVNDSATSAALVVMTSPAVK